MTAITDLDTYRATLNVCHRANANLTGPQKELKLWHDRFVHADQVKVQRLFKMQHFPGKAEEPVIKPKYRSTATICGLSKLTSRKVTLH